MLSESLFFFKPTACLCLLWRIYNRGVENTSIYRRQWRHRIKEHSHNTTQSTSVVVISHALADFVKNWPILTNVTRLSSALTCFRSRPTIGPGISLLK